MYTIDRAAECEEQENKVHEFFKSLAPDKELYELKVKQGMLIVDMAMIASLAKDGVVLTVKGIKFLNAVKVTGKMPKSIE